MQETNKQEYKKVIEYICGLLQENILKVGDRLPAERVIAQKLSISRNSIREALSMLNGMGIVERSQGSGNYVSKNSVGAIQDMIRIMLTYLLSSPRKITEVAKADFFSLPSFTNFCFSAFICSSSSCAEPSSAICGTSFP